MEAEQGIEREEQSKMIKVENLEEREGERMERRGKSRILFL